MGRLFTAVLTQPANRLFQANSSSQHLRFAFLLGVLFQIALASHLLGASVLPQLHDPRLELTVFASDPQIVTPIGMAIDRGDRIFVIESHTHMPPRNYPGPKSDRIKIFEDSDRDGQPERITVFAEGLRDAMSLAFSPAATGGALYVVCGREVWALEDANNDGVSDSRRRVLELKTPNAYAHSALLGITFGPDGWLYVSRGNNGSALYTLTGSDGSTVSGYGDGGNIVRCRPDGSNLEQFATGFWNPFDIKFDSFGRLLCVDNDPDARGPNRLLHIVRHGDYGYKSLYGGSGNHPFQAWEGEMPGTLPMIDGTGEAPSGLLDCARAALPADYEGNVLVTIWNENSITRHRTSPKGVSLTATHSLLVSGDQNFRPVAMDADSRGVIYFTDWVRVEYPNHGRGRIWRLAARTNQPLSKPHGPFSAPKPWPPFADVEALLATTNATAYPQLENTLRSSDPFLRHAAVMALSRPAFRDQVIAAARHRDPAIRLGALLALRRAGIEDARALLRQWLADPSIEIRRMALVWIGEAMLADLKDALEDALRGDNISGALFETYLAAVESLDPEFIRAFRSRSKSNANQLKRALPPGLIARIVAGTNRSTHVRALALTRLDRREAENHFNLLAGLATNSQPALQKEALRTIARVQHPAATAIFESLIFDRSRDKTIRAEALLALSGPGVSNPAAYLPLLDDSDRVIRAESVRLFRFHTADVTIRTALEKKLEVVRSEANETALVEQLEYALFPPGSERLAVSAPRPDSLEAWQAALARGGDPAAGERVFFSSSTACAQCHTIGNRGGKLGPDLGNIGQSVNRAQMIHSILRPSDQFPPQYQAWFVKTTDNEIRHGLQLDHGANGALELLTASGDFELFNGAEIESYGVLPQSLMPNGLEQGMTQTEFRDLVAFLESMK